MAFDARDVLMMTILLVSGDSYPLSIGLSQLGGRIDSILKYRWLRPTDAPP